MRELYAAFKEVYRLIRLASGAVLMTAVYKNYFPDEVLANSEFVVVRLGTTKSCLSVRRTFVIINIGMRMAFTSRRLDPWEDKVPKRAVFGLP
jgi:hypothetical protein